MRKFIIGLLSMLATACLAIGLAGCEEAVGIKDIYLNDNKELIVELTDGTIKNLGAVTENTPSNYSEGLSYTISEDGTYYSVSGIGLCSDIDVVIPATYRGLPVKEIAENAFYKGTLIRSITIPDSVTSIGVGAFWGCGSLTSITVSEDNEVYQSIDGNLYSKDGKTLIRYAIGKTATSFTIPDSVTSIGDSAFSGCESLTSVEIPDRVTSIGDDAFRYCNSLTDATCPALAISYLPKSNLGAVTITSGEIPDSAFSNCSKLTSVVIPDSVTSIGNYAFSYCSSLTSVVIGNSVTSIGDYAFSYCYNLTKIQYTATECEDFASNNWVFYKAGQSGAGITVRIGSNVKKIPAHMFTPYDNSSDAPKIVSVVFEEGGVCESIGVAAFYHCDSLTSVVISDSVTSIGVWAFKDCSGLTSIEIPDSVTSIGHSAFYNCSSLTSVVIGNSVTSIDNWAFEGCSSLTSVVIPDSVTSIGVEAFYGCSSLTSVVIPDSVTSIGYSAFYHCDNLTSIEIPDSVTSIGRQTFYNCTSLTSVVIGDSVTSIGEYAFRNCSSLTSITFNGTVAQWNAISKGSYWNYYVPATEVVCTDGTVAI